MRDTLFAVAGGDITRAKRLVQGSNLGWRLTVEPDGSADVVMTVRPTGLCGGVRGVCTWRYGAFVPLQIGYEAWVPGPLD